jgi:hypothetical protein
VIWKVTPGIYILLRRAYYRLGIYQSGTLC